MRKKIVKILVASVTSICLMFTLINSHASSINNNFNSYILDDTQYSFKNYSNIINLNDLKGTFWILGIDGYEMSQNYYDELFGLIINYNSYSDCRRIPFVLQPRNLYCRETFGYTYNPNAVLSFLSLKSGTSLFYSFLTDNPYLGLELFNITNNNGVIQTGASFQTINIMFDYSYEMQFIYDIAFPNHPNNLINCMGFPTTIICFPNSNEYTLSFSAINPNVSEGMVLNIFKKYCTQITPSSFDNLIGQFEYSRGYTLGYDEGLSAGEALVNNGYRISWLTGVINSVSDILSIEIFPNVTIGYFLLVPLALGIVGMIFYFWRKD